MNIITNFRLTKLILYSFEEWKVKDEWINDWALGYYSNNQQTIHVLKELSLLKHEPDCPKEFMELEDNYVDRIIYHEYVHSLQWRKGREETPLLIKEEGLKISDITKNIYASYEGNMTQEYMWLLEEEARSLELNPELIDELEELVESYLKEEI